MNGTRERTGGGTVKIDGYTRFCLSAIVVLLAILIVGLWAEGPISPIPDAAGAGVAKTPPDVLPNAGAQRLAMIKAIGATNDKLDKIIDLLKSGEIRVGLVEEGKGDKAPDNVHKLPKK
ncbi:MAG: hypothetical protein SVV80_00595 [Planctomycetota bacterium]|nr:hypothetical protein [Planctomycetota bacterium]